MIYNPVRSSRLKLMNVLVLIFFVLTVAVAAFQGAGLQQVLFGGEPAGTATPVITPSLTQTPAASPAVSPTATPGVTVTPQPTATKKIPTLPSTEEKVVYLTFDDGPSREITPQILQILKDKGVKATFFVTGEMIKLNPDVLKQVHSEGHVIGNHTYSHVYKEVYKDVPTFLDELEKNNQLLAQHLDGYTTKVVRFPGGASYENRRPFKEAAHEAGYQIYDWNALTGDAEGKSIKEMREYYQRTVGKKKTVVLLMHDYDHGQDTVKLLPEIIDYLRKQGYQFGLLGKDTLYD